MKTIEDLMLELDGADPETVNRIAMRDGSLPTRLAMLGLAALQKGSSPLWWGYPPGVFIGYKWDGPATSEAVASLAEHIRGQGYRAFLDVENLDADADAYFQIPQYITSLQGCTFYVLLLTRKAADMIEARNGKTTWIFDEYQHALRLVNSGRLFLVPVVLEADGMLESLGRDQVLDVTQEAGDWSKLNGILAPAPLALAEHETEALAAAMRDFDRLFLSEQWAAAADVLHQSRRYRETFDHRFRDLLYGIYTADQDRVDVASGILHATYGQNLVYHIYKGYCEEHGIPNQVVHH